MFFIQKAVMGAVENGVTNKSLVKRSRGDNSVFGASMRRVFIVCEAVQESP